MSFLDNTGSLPGSQPIERPIPRTIPTPLPTRNPRSAVERPDLNQTISDMLFLHSPITGFQNQLQRGLFIRDPNHDAMATVLGTRFQPFADRFIGSQSDAETMAIMTRIEEEVAARHRQSLSNTNNAAIAGIINVVSDPFTLLYPTMGIRRGIGFAAGFKRGGAVAAGAMVAEEALLQQQQFVRPLEESLMIVGASTLFAATLSGFLSRAGGSQVNKTIDAMNRAYAEMREAEAEAARRATASSRTGSGDDIPPMGGRVMEEDADFSPKPGDTIFIEEGRVIDPDKRVGPESASGAATPGATKQTPREIVDEQGVANALGLEKILMKSNPIFRLLASPEETSRFYVQSLSDIPFFLKKNFSGKHTFQSVENFAKRWGYPVTEAWYSMTDAYLRMRGQSGGKGLAVFALRMGDRIHNRQEMGFQEYREEVGKAMRNKDVHDIPEIAEAARAYREKVIIPLRDEAMRDDIDLFTFELRVRAEAIERTINRTTNEARIIGLNEELASIERQIKAIRRHGPSQGRTPSYFPRMWRYDLIVERMNDFKNTLWKEFWNDYGSNMSEDGFKVFIDDITESILRSKPYTKMDEEAIGKASALHARLLDLDDRNFVDFLENDVDAVLRHHARTVGVDVELARMFGRIDMKDQLDLIEKNWLARINASTEPNKTKMRDQMLGDLRDVRALRDRERGTYLQPDDPYRGLSRAYRIAKQYAVWTMMGGATITALSDVARPVMVEGFMRVYGTGLKTLFTNIEGMKILGKETQMAGTALDIVLGTRAMAFSDVGDVFGRHTRMERVASSATGAFFLANLLSPWTATMKMWAGAMIGSRIIEDSIKSARHSRGIPVKTTEFDDLVTGQSGIIRMFKGSGKHGNLADTLKAKKRDFFSSEGEFFVPTEDLARIYGDDVETVHIKITNPKIFGSIEELYALGRQLGFDPIENIGDMTQAITAHLKKQGHDAIVFNGGGSFRSNLAGVHDQIFIIGKKGERPITLVTGGPKISKKGQRMLLRVGIGEVEAERIAAMFEQWGDRDGPLFLPNTELWTDDVATRIFRAAMVGDVDRTIVTPGTGDRPLFMSSELGSVIFQFKSFGVAATSRILVAGLQERDAAFFNGAIMLVAMGMLADEIKNRQFGVTGERSLEERILAGVNRSGLLGWFQDAEETISRLSDNRIGLRPWIVGRTHGVSTKGVLGVLGPTASQIANLSEILKDWGAGVHDHTTARAMRRTWPAQNLMYLDVFYDEMEKAARF